MSTTATKLIEHSIGGTKVQFYNVAAGAADTEMTIVTGLRNVLAAIYQPETTEANGICKKNTDSTGTVYGSVYITSVANSDAGTLVVFGE